MTDGMPGPGSTGGEPVDDEVAVVHWPAEVARRDRLMRLGRARLVVVAAGELPPRASDGLEDWIRADCDPVEIFVRKERLRQREAARAPAVLDEDGLLRRGSRWVALSQRELQVARVLLARPGALVKRADLLAVLRPGAASDQRRMIDTVVRRLQRRIAPLGLTVHTVRASGFLLDMGELPS